MDQFTSTQPIYLQIMDFIQREIISTRLKPLDQLPSVRELALRYQVNPNTVQRALSELERIGLVKSDRTIGRFVCDAPELIKSLRHTIVQEHVDQLTKVLVELEVSESECIQAIKEAYTERKSHD